MSKNIYHIHHIIPKYRGGTDDPSNLIKLTIDDHAEAHRVLWLEHGDYRDYLAWKGLAGLLSKAEILAILFEESGRKGGKARWASMTDDEKKKFAQMGARACYGKHKDKIDARLRANAKMIQEQGLGGIPTDKWIWITDGETNEKVLKEDPIPENWKRGRTHNWTKPFTNTIWSPPALDTCEHCGYTGLPHVIEQWHNEKCFRWVTNGFEEKQVHFTKPLEEGWQDGRYIDTFTIETRTPNYPHPVMKKHCPVCNQLLDAGNFKLHVKSKKCSLTYVYAEDKVCDAPPGFLEMFS